jgi:hypothetical protein
MRASAHEYAKVFVILLCRFGVLGAGQHPHHAWLQILYLWERRRTRWLTRWRAGSKPWLERPWSRHEQTRGAAVATALADQIARLNQVGKMSFKEALSLRVGGMDQYSRWQRHGTGNRRRSLGCLSRRCRISRAGCGSHQSMRDGAALDGAWAGGTAGLRRVQVDREMQANRRQRDLG